jgi:hypothetical protein
MNIQNPAFDYDNLGQKYSGHRQTDPRIAAYIFNELKDAKTILNVGAGAGSYDQPTNMWLLWSHQLLCGRKECKMGSSPQ